MPDRHPDYADRHLAARAMRNADATSYGRPQVERHAAEKAASQVALAAYEAAYPHRGDPVERWLKRERAVYVKAYANRTGGIQHPDVYRYLALDRLLEEYRLAADTGSPLGGSA